MGVKVRRRRIKLGLLIVVTLVLAVMAWPREDAVLSQLGVDSNLKIRRGLDLQGGVYLVYEAEIGSTDQASSAEILKNAAAVIERRVNPGGAGEAIVQTASANRIVVQIPGLDDPAQALATIGRTAQLEFYEVTEGEAGAQLGRTAVNGQDVRRATINFGQTGQPTVSLELKSGQSADEFAELTTRLAGTSTSLVAILDDQIVFGPAGVQTPITDGRAELSGNFTVKEANEVTTLLNAGALPVPVKLVAQQTIGPTLGELSVKESLVASVVGLLAVSIFLVVYYRWAGLMVVGALAFYTMALMSIIKLSVFTPYVIVLTLAGIAGFILSVAVAVDANVLIIERIKEELEAGQTPLAAAQAGFEHAWHSIRDANATTIISAFILYQFGAPLIKGFALTLGVGVAISLATAFSVSRLLLKTLARSRLSATTTWVGLKGERK